MKFKIDNLQYCNWSRKVFEINREAGLDAVHVTIVYHEDFEELLVEIDKWQKLFKENSASTIYGFHKNYRIHRFCRIYKFYRDTIRPPQGLRQGGARLAPAW